MRVLIHDRPGYAFSVQLSRELARRGHSVLHVYDKFFQSPKGNLVKEVADSPNFEVIGLNIQEPFQKYNLIKRRFQEVEYGKLLAERVRDFRPHIMFSANTTPDAQEIACKACHTAEVRFVSWVHDIHGLAIGKILRQKWSIVGALAGWYYLRREKWLLQHSDAVILITQDFAPLMESWGIDQKRLHLIPNWAPIDDIPVRPKVNPWAIEHGIADKFCLLYAGTLGLKHNPELLLELASHFKGDPEVRILVASEGLGANWLREKKQALKLQNLLLVDFQSPDVFADMLAAGDVLIAILTPDAGTFSVPSKVLSYLCAQRALLLAVPEDNLAARIVSQNRAGLVVPAADLAAFVAAAEVLRRDVAERAACAGRARAYAQANFDLKTIGDHFEQIISS